MRHVDYYGVIYRISNRSFTRLLKLISDGKEWDLQELGAKLVVGRYTEITDMGAEEAKGELEFEDHVKGEK